MEAIHDSGRARLLGISNVSVDQLRALYDSARIKPRMVQNRCYAVQGWDRQVREFCNANGLAYQGFSLLTANREIMKHQVIRRIASRYGRTASQIVFRFALDAGMIPLTGTTDAGHMMEDLDAFEFGLEPGEVEQIERVAG